MKKWIATIVIGASALSASASYLGENSVQAGMSYLDYSVPAPVSVDGWGTDVNVNLNLQRSESSGIDINFGAGYSKITSGGFKLTGESIYVSGIYFIETGNIKPFVSIDLGYLWQKEKTSGNKADGLNFGATIGVEYNPSDVLTITVAGGISHDEEFSEDTWGAGISAIYWIQPNSGIGLGVSNSNEGSVDTRVITATYTFKF